MANVPMDKAILHKWLKAGFMERQIWYDSYSGTPQGGIISPVLANLALDGLEQRLHDHFPHEMKRKGRRLYLKVNLIRYADDFVITGESKALLEQQVKPVVEAFLAERGLRLSPEKTRITHIDDGFDFLGQNIRKYHGKLLIKPSKKSVKTLLSRVRVLLKRHRMAKQEVVLNLLNPLIRGWAQYHRHVVAKAVFNKVDHWIWRALWRWACFRHPTKRRRWVMARYFHPSGNRRQVFGVRYSQEQAAKKGRARTNLVHMVEYAIRRHTKIKGEANPYAPHWETYFEARLQRQMISNPRGGKKVLHLWLNQAGTCPNCQQRLERDERWNLHHIRPKHAGGSDAVSNLIILHENCHRQVHSAGLRVVKPVPPDVGLKDA